MPDLLHTSGPTTSSTANVGGRNYDYTNIYPPDKPGEELKENARVWNVYLDEAENYDADMIQGFRNISDGLLVFAALFSAVVTTFVAQTSQSLQPDNMEIMTTLLVETNQLLRAAGNRTTISTVPTAALVSGCQTYTSIDVWVNGLFFTSLALSLSTALLTVLAKQWIQAYTAIVPGGAKTRALVRHFRFRGLMKWKLGDIIEGLPVILHGSVAIFLVGLALYVSQLSSPICVVISAITALTFLFYVGTSMLPAFDIACPYRIPFMFSLAQLVLFAFHATRYAFLHLWCMLMQNSRWLPWPEMLGTSLKMAEQSELFGYHEFSELADIILPPLGWVFNHSSNHSVKEVIVEGVRGLFDKHSSIFPYKHEALFWTSEWNDLFLSVVKWSISQLIDMSTTSSIEDEIEKSTYGRLFGTLMKVFTSSTSDGPIPIFILEYRKESVETELLHAYRVAVKRKYHALSRCILNWLGPNLLHSTRGYQLLFECACFGDGQGIHDLADQGMDLNRRNPGSSWTSVHYAARLGNLDGVIALVEQEPALLSAKTNPPDSSTALDFAVGFLNPDVVAYLLDCGANLPSMSALHVAMWPGRVDFDLDRCLEVVTLLLDHGWDRTAKDADGRTLIDIAWSGGYDVNMVQVVEHLEHYQTVRLPPLFNCATHPRRIENIISQ